MSLSTTRRSRVIVRDNGKLMPIAFVAQVMNLAQAQVVLAQVVLAFLRRFSTRWQA